MTGDDPTVYLNWCGHVIVDMSSAETLQKARGLIFDLQNRAMIHEQGQCVCVPKVDYNFSIKNNWLSDSV